MLNLERLDTKELENLSQRISFAIDMSYNEENYTILDEIENIIEMRSEIENTEIPVVMYDNGDI